MQLLNLLGTAYLLTIFTLQVVAQTVIYPGVPWTDTNGDSLQAHGGGIIKVGPVWYWFGENKIENNSNFLSVNCYSSSDLVNWKFEVAALSPISGTNISSANIVERPKVIFNEMTKKYVMYFHNDNSDYSLAMVGVATSDSVNGKYTYVGSFQPLDSQSRDMGLFQDDGGMNMSRCYYIKIHSLTFHGPLPKGSAYLLFASDNNQNFKIANLSTDYLTVSSLVHQFTNVNYEAGGIFKRNDQYFLIVSHTSGWAPNPNKFLKAKSLSGPWSNETDIAPSNTNTYSSQNAFDLNVAGTKNASFIYYGDRWISTALSASRYIWLPFRFDSNGNPSITWYDAWKIDVDSGQWSAVTATVYEAESSANTVSGGSKISSCTMCSGSEDVTYIGKGGTLQFNKVIGHHTNVTILITYFNNDSTNRYLLISVNGGSPVNYTTTPTNGMLGVFKMITMLTAEQNNTILMSNPTAYGPDIDRLAIVNYA